jgi:hypothetical protein
MEVTTANPNQSKHPQPAKVMDVQTHDDPLAWRCPRDFGRNFKRPDRSSERPELRHPWASAGRKTNG